MSEPMESEGEGEAVSQKRTSGNSSDCASSKKSQRLTGKTETDSSMLLGSKGPVAFPAFVHGEQKSVSSERDQEKDQILLPLEETCKSTSGSIEILKPIDPEPASGSGSESGSIFGKTSAEDNQTKTDDSHSKQSETKTILKTPAEISPVTGDQGTLLYTPPTLLQQTSEPKPGTVQSGEPLSAASSSGIGGIESKTEKIDESIPGEKMLLHTGLDARKMGDIARKIGKDWSEIAIQMGFSQVQTHHLQEMYKDSLYDRNLCMINTWYQAVEGKFDNPKRLLAHCISNINTDLAGEIDPNFRDVQIPTDLDPTVQEIIIGREQPLQSQHEQAEMTQTGEQYRADVGEQFRCTIQSWMDLDKYCYETNACKRAMSVIDRNGTVTLVGPTGEGKSFLSHHIALKYRSEGYTIIPVSNIEEIEKFCNPKIKQLFVLDDPLGSLCLEKKLLSEWVTKNDKIKSMVEQGLTKFIATIRTSIYQKASRQIKKTIFSKHCVDLTSEEFRLDLQERENILTLHCKDVPVDRIKKVTGSYFPGFPFLCHLLRIDNKSQEEMGSDLDPFHLLLNQIEEIEEKEQYCALVLTAMFDGSFDPEELDSLIDEEGDSDLDSQKSKKIIKLCGLNPNEENLDHIKKSFDHLKNVYFLEKESEFYFLHDIIFSVVAYHFGNKHVSVILQWCSSKFIQERVRLKDFETKEIFDGIKPIEIPKKKYLDFAKRLTKDLSEKKHVHVFQNPSIHHTAFQDTWIKHLLKTYNKDNLLAIMSANTEAEEDADVLKNLQKTLDFAILSSSPINWLCKHGMLSMLKQILSQYSNLNQILDELPGHTKPLHFASGCGHIDLVKYLIELGVDVNCKSSLEKEQIGQTSVAEYYTGFTPLFYAARENHLEVVEYLLQKGAKPNLVRDHGASPMLLTADRGHAKVVETLIKYGGDPNLCCDHGTSPLILAASENHVDTMKVLIDHDAELDTQKIETGVSAVSFAASRGHKEALSLLLDKKANPDLRTKDGLSPLAAAINGGYLKCAELLVENGANIELCDNCGSSPLLLTVRRKCKETPKDDEKLKSFNKFIKLLLDKGANTSAKNRDNESPLSLAASHNDEELETLLKE